MDVHAEIRAVSMAMGIIGSRGIPMRMGIMADVLVEKEMGIIY